MVPPVIFRVLPFVTLVIVPKAMPPPISSERLPLIKALSLKLIVAFRKAAIPPPLAKGTPLSVFPAKAVLFIISYGEDLSNVR